MNIYDTQKNIFHAYMNISYHTYLYRNNTLTHEHSFTYYTRMNIYFLTCGFYFNSTPF
jgi:hypothetical protein